MNKNIYLKGGKNLNPTLYEHFLLELRRTLAYFMFLPYFPRKLIITSQLHITEQQQ